MEAEARKAAREAEARKAEAEERRAAREAEAAEIRAEREAEERRAEREAKREQEKARLQLEQAKLTYEIKKVEMKAGEDQESENEGLCMVTKVPVEDIFPIGVEELAAHVHLPSQGRSSSTLVVASATWLGTVCPVGVTPVEASVEGHEGVTEGHSVVANRARVEVST